MRLMKGADIDQIAKSCRTSVEIIKKFHAAHIKTTFDAPARASIGSNGPGSLRSI
jgi:hypothetical protein